ncbi:rRNA (adenine-N6,N6-)-dimethyltransferase activity [Nesidiocoris tenuis]|uniref:rRNA adenine N(6)-methyltransferase n=1 Tax=Nesidiocoris tenuis TaxID=355587 RepID=A0ABN7ANW1_9HEMI|nr:rRNA (adenine-N6,N6-)-dimethyltransferase activity [Nesidiocoris tenuis]
MSGHKMVQRLPPLPTIKDILRLYNLRAMKQLSQNFIMESRITDKIAKVAGDISGGHVCEVGPGPGNITRSIINRNPKSILLVEKDRRFLPPLEMLAEAAPCPVKIVVGDILTVNMESLFPQEEAKVWTDSPPNIHLIGNLPFNVATPLIIRWLRCISEKSSAWKMGRVRMTLTFQKEVAERMVAPILTKERCRLSVMAQNWCHIEHRFNIPGKAFVPKPDVDVGVVHFVPLVTPLIELPFELVEKVARCMFSFRQKHCIKCFANLFPKATRDSYVRRLLEDAEIPYDMRSFQLTMPEIRRVCFAYQRILDETPILNKYNYRKHLDADMDSILEDEERGVVSL